MTADDSGSAPAGTGISGTAPARRRRGCLRILAAVLVLGTGFVGWGVVSGCRLRATGVEIPIAGLPAEFDGLRIAQVSDVHYVGPDRLHDRVVRAIAEAGPDVVVFTGDYVERPEHLAACAKLLSRMAGGRRAYAVPGNWEYWAGVGSEIGPALQSEGISVLFNRSAVLERGGARLHFAGVDDPIVGNADVAAAVRGIPDGEAVVLLAHAAEIIDRPAAGRAALILCGHTHGGQARLFGRPVVTPYTSRPDMMAGLYRQDGTRIYVNSGMGTSVVRLRFYCPPELTVITLRRAPG